MASEEREHSLPERRAARGRGRFRAPRLHLGGRWYRYGIMHFEYRPELLAAAGMAR
jgi:hypothetical protein